MFKLVRTGKQQTFITIKPDHIMDNANGSIAIHYRPLDTWIDVVLVSIDLQANSRDTNLKKHCISNDSKIWHSINNDLKVESCQVCVWMESREMECGCNTH